MTERLVERSEASSFANFRADINDYFYAAQSKDERARFKNNPQYVDTNNLHLRFVEGFVDFSQEPYWHVMQEFRDIRPDLWESVKEAAAKRHEETSVFGSPEKLLELLSMTPEEQNAAIQMDNERKWEFEIIKNEAFDALAPMLIEAGIHPLKVCI